MALSVNAGKDGGASDERVASCYDASSSSCRQDGNAPPPAQQMDRQPTVSLQDNDGDGGCDHGRIPAAVFERDASESNKDWSMMSTESVFALQVAPSCDFTGYFLAHPELMDISTPPRPSTGTNVDPGAVVSAPPQFESIPERGNATMNGSYSFAFPNLIEDKRYSSKKVQANEQPPAAAATATAQVVAPPPEAETSSKQEAAPEKASAKCGLLSCFPCCSS